MKYAVLCAVYIALWVGMAATSVGKIPQCSGGPFSVWLPLLVFSLLAVPAVLGYLAGEAD